MPDRFQIFLRRRQNQFEGVNVIVRCNSATGYAEYTPGIVDNVTAFMDIIPLNGWYDFTNYIEGQEKLSLTWDKVNSGNSTTSQTNQDGSNYDKGITSDMLFFDKAYHFIFAWLLTTECHILNCVEVKIIDLIARQGLANPAGNYRIFEIKSDNLDYAPVDEPCQINIKLREQDNTWHCIHKTFIWDNWQHWFEDSPIKEHPCFLTCIEPRPRLVSSARMALMLFYYSNPAVRAINLISGQGNIRDNARRILNADRFVDAPLVRTYIENVAGKCGLAMDTIFDVGEDWENLCIYYPQAGYMHEYDGDEVVSPSLAYHFDNRWLITIAELLDKLKIVFAAEWYVTPDDTIVFKHTKDLIQLAPIYDFTLPGAEPIHNLRYSFNGNKKPAYGRYKYQDDGSDLASQEMSTLYSDIIDYDGPANNPMLEGERSKSFEFAPTGFIRDGRSSDYLNLLIQDGKVGALILIGVLAVVATALIGGFLSAGGGVILLIVMLAWVGVVFIQAGNLKNEFVDGPTYDGAVRLTSEQTLTPRLLLWDGLSEQRAKVVMRFTMPSPAPFYNPDLTAYDIKNKIGKDNPDENIYNYPLYFDGDFTGNMFDSYHDIIDNPLKSLETHQDVKWNVDLCESMLNLFGVFEDQYAKIGKIVKLEVRDNYDVYVRIGNINVDYQQHKINLKGTVLRRVTSTVVPPFSELPGTEGEEPPPDTTACLKWKNDSNVTAEEVIYRDCFGELVSADIIPLGTFCAYEIISIGDGGNIVATNTCVPAEESGESGSGESGEVICYTFQNLSLRDALGVSYTDCDGNIITDATIPAMSDFCAQSVEDAGTCGNLVNMGLCECEGTISMNDTIVIEAVVDEIPIVTGTTEPVTGIVDGSTTVTCTDFVGVRVIVIRGNIPIPGIDPLDGSNYFTKLLASDTITFSQALVAGEFIRIQTILK